MAKLPCILKGIVTAIIVTILYAVPLSAQTDNGEVLDQLFVELAEADEGSWEQIEQKIWSEWSRSGSAAMDLLLERGRAAMEVGDLDAAIEWAGKCPAAQFGKVEIRASAMDSV